MYKMSSAAERLTQERKITVKSYTKNKIHIICVIKWGTDDFYVIWVKMIDWQKRLVHRNLCHVAMISYCKTKRTTKELSQKIQKKNW